MNKETREALEGSIKKWKDIADGTGIDEGPDNCPLCKLFFDHGCRDCPIKERTGIISCWKTPYEEWAEHFKTEHSVYIGDKKILCNTCKVIAEKEVIFLESLKEKEFKPFKLTIDINTKEDLINMWHRLNISAGGIEKEYEANNSNKPYKWKILNDLIKKYNIEL